MKSISNLLSGAAAIALLMGLASCNIDRKPYDKFSDIPDDLFVESNTLGIYAYMKGTGLDASWINNAHRLTEYNGDNVALSGSTTDDLFYMYNYQRVDNGWRNNDFWTRSYRTIFAANHLIDRVSEGVSPAYDRSLGEAYFLRALMHFYLVNVYGRPYTQGAGHPGVPIRINSDVNDVPPRATVGQVYAQVIKDLGKADSLMGGKAVKEPYFANPMAAHALLSRVYLYMGDNERALRYADTVINLGGGLRLLGPEEFRNMNTLTPERNAEAIFSIRYVTGLDEGDQNNGVGGFYAYIDGYGWGEMYASRTYLDLVNYFPGDARQAFIEPQYEKDDEGRRVEHREGAWVRHTANKDGSVSPRFRFGRDSVDLSGVRWLVTLEGETKRSIRLQSRMTPTGVREYFFNEGEADTLVHLDYTMTKREGYPKFYITKCSRQDGQIHSWSPSILRLAEMYLNKAEALAKLGRRAEAVAALNALRANRGVPDYVDGDLVLGRGKADLLEVILDERRLELAYEGHRALDVFRNKMSLDRDYPGTHALNAQQLLKVPFDANQTVQYIPLAQMNAQGNLVQNP